MVTKPITVSLWSVTAARRVPALRMALMLSSSAVDGAEGVLEVDEAHDLAAGADLS